MPAITKKEFDDYQQLCKGRNNGRILTPDGLRFICESYKTIRKPLECICWKHRVGYRARSAENGNYN